MSNADLRLARDMRRYGLRLETIAWLFGTSPFRIAQVCKLDLHR